ncbi:MAG: thioredoxin fold domain-containing protein [bacterium]|nr:MAG: thioredoxin fold domain-containing protein [bacterium]
MKLKRTATVIFTLAVITSGCGDREPAKEGTVINEWLPFDTGIARSSREKKPVVIDFYTSWCRWCKVMDEKTFSRPEIQRYLADNFVSIRINAESKTDRFSYNGKTFTPVQLTRHFGVRGFPSLAYLDKEGKLITVVPGFVPPETFLPFLHYIKKECYGQQISFEEFLKKKKECE